LGVADLARRVRRLGAAAGTGVVFAAGLAGQADGDRVARRDRWLVCGRVGLFVLAGYVQVQLVALGAALDLVEDRLHALQIGARDLVRFERAERRHLAADERLDDRRQRAQQLL